MVDIPDSLKKLTKASKEGAANLTTDVGGTSSMSTLTDAQTDKCSDFGSFVVASYLHCHLCDSNEGDCGLNYGVNIYFLSDHVGCAYDGDLMT